MDSEAVKHMKEHARKHGAVDVDFLDVGEVMRFCNLADDANDEVDRRGMERPRVAAMFIRWFCHGRTGASCQKQ